MSEPKIYSRNFIDDESVYTLSHSGNSEHLYDRNDQSLYVTVGAADDAQNIDVEIEFYEGGIQQSRTLDTLALLNHNLKTWSLYKWNGASYDLVTSQAADAQTSRVISFASITTTKVKLSCTATQTPDQEKEVGQMILCELSLDIGYDMQEYSPRWREKVKDLLLADGSIHRVYSRGLNGRLTRYQAAMRFSYLPTATRDALKAIKDAGVPFLWQPESAASPYEFYFVHWLSPWRSGYASKYKGAGHVVDAEFREV